MYKQLFEKIINSNNTFNKEEQKVVDKLLKDSILTKQEDKFEINSKFKIAKVKFEKNYALLEDISNEHKNIKLEFDLLNGAYEGDFVVAKRIFNPRSKIKAKIVHVFSSKVKELLVYVQENSLFTVKESIELDFKVNKKYQDGQILLVNSKDFETIKI